MPMSTPLPAGAAMQTERRRLEPQYNSGPRLHSSHNLLLLRRGVLLYRDISRQIRLEAPAAIFTPRGTRHQFQAGPGGCLLQLLRIRLSAFGLHVEADAEAWELVMSLVRHVHRNGPVIPLASRPLAEVRAALASMARLQHSERPGRLALIKAVGMQIIARLAAELPPGSLRPPPRRAVSFEKVRLVIEHIENFFPGPVTIQDLARRAGLGRSQFHTVFRDYTGLSVIDYLTRVRIGEACRRLRDTDDDVLSIAHRCGFASPSRFYEAFQAIIGEAPGRWRRRTRAFTGSGSS